MTRCSLTRLLLVLLLCMAQAAVFAAWHPHVAPCQTQSVGLESGEHHEEVVSEASVGDDRLSAQRWHAEAPASLGRPHLDEILHVPRPG